MTGAFKHAQRSRKSRNKAVDFSGFVKKAATVKVAQVQRKSFKEFLQNLLHKKQDK